MNIVHLKHLEFFVGNPVLPTALKYRAKRACHFLDKTDNSPETHPCAVLANVREMLEAIVKGCAGGRCCGEGGGLRWGRRRCSDDRRVLVVMISNRLGKGGIPTYPDILFHFIKDNITVLSDCP